MKCQHYWDIDQSNVGVCRKCGEERQFSGNVNVYGKVVKRIRKRPPETREEKS